MRGPPSSIYIYIMKPLRSNTNISPSKRASRQTPPYEMFTSPPLPPPLQDHLSYFYFVGRIIGIAIFHNHYLDGGFTLPFYKQLLGKSIVLDDIEGVDPELHRSLVWMLLVSIYIENTMMLNNCDVFVLKSSIRLFKHDISLISLAF